MHANLSHRHGSSENHYVRPEDQVVSAQFDYVLIFYSFKMLVVLAILIIGL